MRAVGPTRGFTLIELMITVAIIGVLAVLASVGYARWSRTAKTAEATANLGLIKGAQETYRAEALRYLDVSAGDLDKMHPSSPPKDAKAKWDPKACVGAVPCDGFAKLNLQGVSEVYYQYSCAAGLADGGSKAFAGRTFGVANDPWYVARARGDLNANDVPSFYWISSWSGAVTSVNPDE